MGAPSGTKWGSTAGGYGCIGIYHTLSSTNTETTLTVEVWFWSKYSVSDNLGNALYLDNLASSGSATTNRGGTNIQTTVATGSGWSTSNQVKLTSKSYTWKHTRGTSASTRYIYAKLTGVDRVGETMYASTTVSIPALAKYTVAYNANGGSGAPSSQTKYYGKNLTLSSTKPTRTGYSFQGWALTKANADAGTWYYSAGGTCGKNENLTLYAVWKADTYDVNYNANGGTGAPSKQTKTYGKTLTLSSTKPTRSNYNFLGWATSAASNTVAYKAGASYTANSGVTLYAVWELAYVKPRITKFEAYRADINGNESELGTWAGVRGEWECDQPVVSVAVELKRTATDETIDVLTFGLSGETYGSFDAIMDGDPANELSLDASYTCRITVTDSVGSNAAVATISGTKYIIDILAQGKGIAFNKPAELEGVMDIGFQTRFQGGILYNVIPSDRDLNTICTPGFYVGKNVSYEDVNYENCPITSGTFTLEVISAGPNGQVTQRLIVCDKTKTKTFERTYYGESWCDWYGSWIYPEITSEFGMYGSSAADNQTRYRKDGRMVEIRGVITPTNEIAGSTTTYPIFTLPTGYRPTSPIYLICQGSGAAIWNLSIKANGEVGFSRYRLGDTLWACSNNTWLPFQATFLTE